ncbi:hypothetical protein HPB49_025082 [Dermacentor silvarum]|uniref:Uncharacterized protein n=1 Tax=Dermacentor silvarum TaxID=543639 RepID=A0ACB8CCC6_DERSI|nr:hypothetical protein HPB49_025082 [Dermacentor silvarum]
MLRARKMYEVTATLDEVAFFPELLWERQQPVSVHGVGNLGLNRCRMLELEWRLCRDHAGYATTSMYPATQLAGACEKPVLWRGLVYDANDNSTEVTSLRAFNKKLHQDERIDVCLLPLADGLTFARKK